MFEEIQPVKKILLLILDGFGVAPDSKGNAISQSRPSNLISLWDTNPHTYLEASGEAVGLTPNTNGNSEVGHLTIGSGKINYQNLLKINNAIEKGIYFSNIRLLNLLYHAKKNNGKIHLMGCFSDGAVHSHIDHFTATLRFLKLKNFQGEVLIHAFTDGRDTPPKSAEKFFEKLELEMRTLGIGKFATICGRAFAMDRNNVLERTQKAYDLMVRGKGYLCKDWHEGIQAAYERGETDEYIQPTLIVQGDPKSSLVSDNDSVLFMNFRPDRAIQLSKAFMEQITVKFDTAHLKNIYFVGMVEYQKNFPARILYPKEYISLPIGRVLADAGLRQLRLAESEKFPHVTYFLNGGLPIQYDGEDRIKIPSPQVATYDLQPEMSIEHLHRALSEKLKSVPGYNFIAVNIANGDMVGHTGNLEAGIRAVQIVDSYVADITKEAMGLGWTIVITADHGNVERMIEPGTLEPNTEHTQNPVPFIVMHPELQKLGGRQLKLGALSDVGPTILRLFGIDKPQDMYGRSLI